MNWLYTPALVLLVHGLALFNCIPLPNKAREKDKENKPGNRFGLKKAANYLKSFGYTPDDFSDEDPTEDGIKDFLTSFQSYAAIPVTGTLDNTTVAKMKESRCGMRDPRKVFKIKGKRQRRYVLQGGDWLHKLGPDRKLTWKVINGGSYINKELTRKIMFDSFAKWSKAANLHFEETTSDDADILVSFAAGSHGDFYPFDGRGGTLAHAFYPFPGAAISGDVHFDNDEHFTYRKDFGTDIMWVAVHEVGHSLGLEHSDRLEAIMYPWYRGSTGKDFDLTNDDVRGIQHIYGPALNPTTVPATTTKQATTTTKIVEPPVPTEKSTTIAPTAPPTEATTAAPTDAPTAAPTDAPTAAPTAAPTDAPTAAPTDAPTAAPTDAPTAAPTDAPTAAPTDAPTAAPTDAPTAAPTDAPTAAPTDAPTAAPTDAPTAAPTDAPTAAPTDAPTAAPTDAPTAAPTDAPTAAPTDAPTAAPTDAPTAAPTEAPTAAPTDAPTTTPKTTPVKTPEPVEPTNPSCIPSIDAAVVAPDGWVYIFSGHSFFLISRRGLEYGPFKVNTYFFGITDTITAAFRKKDDSLVLFTGDKYYIYNGYVRIAGPGPVTDFGLPSGTKVDAALVWNGNSNADWERGDKVYLFSGVMYFRHDVRTGTIDSGYPAVISERWHGLPSEVNAAFSGYSSFGFTWQTHFISKNQFLIFDDR
eukprot:gene2412-18061_t